MGVQAARIVFPPEDRAEIAAAITGILTTGALTLGPYTKQFEAAFAAAHDSPHAVAIASGTAALEISLRAVGVDGRDVIVPANTFYATAAAILRAGGRPVFADIDAATFALSPDTITAALTPDTAAVVLVHIAGLITPHADEIKLLCEQRGIVLVEDAAHAHGATYDGRFAGSFGAAAAFSFYPTKVVTSGEGGMIATPSADLADEARIYRDQGKGAFTSNHHVRLGYAWRLSEQNAVTGLVHLRRMDEFITRRREVAARYDKALAGLDGLEPLSEPPAAAATSTSTSCCCRPARTAAGSSRSWRASMTSGWPGRSTTCRCTSSRCWPNTPAARCRLPKTCAPGTFACRSIRTCEMTRLIRC